MVEIETVSEVVEKQNRARTYQFINEVGREVAQQLLDVGRNYGDFDGKIYGEYLCAGIKYSLDAGEIVVRWRSRSFYERLGSDFSDREYYETFIIDESIDDSQISHITLDEKLFEYSSIEDRVKILIKIYKAQRDLK